MPKKILPIFIPFMGCAYKCVYCDQTAITGINQKDFSDSVNEQFKLWSSRFSEYDEIAFYGGTFGGLSKGKRDILYKIASGKPIRVSTAPDSISNDFLEEIKEYNISTVELGVQSLSNNVLRANNRNYTYSDVIDAVNKLKNLEISVSTQFMVGMYKENREDIIYTVDKIRKDLNSDISRIYPTLILSNTQLYEYYSAGEYTPLSFAETIMRTALYYASLMSINNRVIRMGLPYEASHDSIVGGVRHPALGDIVKTIVISLFCINFNSKPCIDYAGYKGYIKHNFGSLKVDSDVRDLFQVSVKLMELYATGKQWFSEKYGFEIASKFEGETNF